MQVKYVCLALCMKLPTIRVITKYAELKSLWGPTLRQNTCYNSICRSLAVNPCLYVSSLRAHASVSARWVKTADCSKTHFH